MGSVTVEQSQEFPGQKNRHSELAISYSPYLHSALVLRIQLELELHPCASFRHKLGQIDQVYSEFYHNEVKIQC
jgi:hypothetical protein